MSLDPPTRAEITAKPFRSVAFSPDGSLVAGGFGAYLPVDSGLEDCRVVLWKTDSWKKERDLSGRINSEVAGLAFSKDGKQVIGAGDAYHRNVRGNPWDGKRIYRWNADGSKHSALELRGVLYDPFIRSGSGNVRDLTYCESRSLVGMALLGDIPLIIDLRTGKPAYLLEGMGDDESSCLRFSPDGKHIISCVSGFGRGRKPESKPLRRYSAEDGKLLSESDLNGRDPWTAVYSKSGDKLAVGCKNGDMLIMKPDLSKIEVSVPLVKKHILSIDYSPDGEWIAAAVGRDSLYLVPTQDPSKPVLVERDIPWVSRVAFSPDGKLVALAYGTVYNSEEVKPEGGVRVWDVKSKKRLADLK